MEITIEIETENSEKGDTMRHLLAAFLITMFFCTPALASSDGEAARVKTVTGTASIARQEKVIPAIKDEKVYKGDTLKTGPDGSLGITFRDNSLLSLGPNSTVVIDEFLFAPTQGKLSLVTRLVKGTAAILSGVIARLSPQAVRFETPVATVGIRGTKFLVAIDEEVAQ